MELLIRRREIRHLPAKSEMKSEVSVRTERRKNEKTAGADESTCGLKNGAGGS